MPGIERNPSDQQHRRYHELCHGRIRTADAFVRLRHGGRPYDHRAPCGRRRSLHDAGRTEEEHGS